MAPGLSNHRKVRLVTLLESNHKKTKKKKKKGHHKPTLTTKIIKQLNEKCIIIQENKEKEKKRKKKKKKIYFTQLENPETSRCSQRNQFLEINFPTPPQGKPTVFSISSLPSLASSPLGSPVANFHIDCSYAPLFPPFQVIIQKIHYFYSK